MKNATRLRKPTCFRPAFFCLVALAFAPAAHADSEPLPAPLRDQETSTPGDLYSQGKERDSGQVLTDAQGNTFMEEMPTTRRKQFLPTKAPLLQDLRTVDVPVDPNGNIVPLIKKEAGPVLPFYSSFEESVQPLWQFAPISPYPYGFYPYAYPYNYPWLGPWAGYPFGGYGLPYNQPSGNFYYYPKPPPAISPPVNQPWNQRLVAPQINTGGPAAINPWFSSPITSSPLKR
jgi:hypothetical protein